MRGRHFGECVPVFGGFVVSFWPKTSALLGKGPLFNRNSGRLRLCSLSALQAARFGHAQGCRFLPRQAGHAVRTLGGLGWGALLACSAHRDSLDSGSVA